MAKIPNLFVILLLVAAVLVAVEGDNRNVCSEDLGACNGGAQDCDQRCKAVQNGGQGACNGANQCTCYYSCAPPQRKCEGGAGLCSLNCGEDCCNANCASKYNQGIGFCNNLGTNNFCTCLYVCPPLK